MCLSKYKCITDLKPKSKGSINDQSQKVRHTRLEAGIQCHGWHRLSPIFGIWILAIPAGMTFIKSVVCAYLVPENKAPTQTKSSVDSLGAINHNAAFM